MDRRFSGVFIPAEIWLDERLSALDKMIFAEIDSLDNEQTHCYASNKYLADFCQCSETKISNSISKLIELGYIAVVKFDGRTRVLQSCLTKSVRLNNKNCEAVSQNLQQSNIIYNTNKDSSIINNTTNAKNSKSSQKSLLTKPKKSKKDKFLDMFISICDEYDFSEKVLTALIKFANYLTDGNNYLAEQSIRMQISYLYENCKTDTSKIYAIDNTIIRGWKSLVYVIDQDKNTVTANTTYNTANMSCERDPYAELSAQERDRLISEGKITVY